MTLIGVHGFSFDPASTSDNPQPLFDAWTTMTRRPVEGCAYYSYPIGVAGFARARREGYLGEYHAAFNAAAPAAAETLAAKIAAHKDPVDLIGHSLGSRVICLALQHVKAGTVRRVLLLEGAELQCNVKGIPEGAEVLNICSASDHVLTCLGSIFNGQTVASTCIGAHGLGRKMSGWTDLHIDDPATQAAASQTQGWLLDGAKPAGFPLSLRDFGGHWEAYTDPNNAACYRAWFDGASFWWLPQ